MLPAAWRRPAAIVAGLGCLGWLLSLEQLCFVLGFTILLHLLADRPRLAGAALALVYLPLIFSGLLLDFERGDLAEHDRIPAFFLVIYLKKAIYRAWERGVAKTEVPTLLDTAHYFLSLPFALGKAAVVSPQEWRKEGGSFVHGLRTLALAVLHLAGFLAMAAAPVALLVDRVVLAELDSRTWFALYGVVLSNWVAIYLFRYGHEQLSIGAARLLGHEVRDNYQQPLLAKDYAEFWRHWNIHFRDMVVRMFYMPIALTLNRAEPKKKLRNLGAAVVVTFAAHGAFMLLVRGIHLPLHMADRWLELALALAVYEVFEALFVWLTLAWQATRRRTRSRLRLVLGVLLTFHLRAVLVLFVLRRGVGFDDVLDLLRTLALW